MESYAQWILDNITPEWPAGVDTPDKFLDWANDLFWLRGPGVQAMRQTLADWFNDAKAAL